MQRFIFALAGLLALPIADAAPEPLIIYASENYRPISWLDEKAQPRGVALEAIDFVAHDTGFTIKAELLPWNRAYKLAQQGRGGVIGISYTPERAELFDFSAAIYDSGISLVTHKSRPIRFHSLSDLSGKKIGALMGVSYGVEVDQAAKNGLFEFVRDTSHVARFKNLLAGRIDGAFIPNAQTILPGILAGDPELQAHADEFVIASRSVAKDPIHVAFRKGALDDVSRMRLYQSFAKWAKQREGR